MFGKLWPNHRTDSWTTKINDSFHSLPDQHLFRGSWVPYQNSNQFYLNYIFFLHCIVKNANLCLEQNSFISYLLKTRMNKNILLRGMKDFQGFSDYWILHLPKHILKLGAEALRDKGTQIFPQQSRWGGGRGPSQQHLQPPLGTSHRWGQEQLWREGRENWE